LKVDLIYASQLCLGEITLTIVWGVLS